MSIGNWIKNKFFPTPKSDEISFDPPEFDKDSAVRNMLAGWDEERRQREEISHLTQTLLDRRVWQDGF